VESIQTETGQTEDQQGKKGKSERNKVKQIENKFINWGNSRFLRGDIERMCTHIQV
jgi:hypothetical protein